MCLCVCVHAHVRMHAHTLSCSVVSDSVTPWTVVCQAPLSMEFSRQGYWMNLPFPTPGDQFPVSCNEPPGKSIRKHACKKKKKERKHACVHAQPFRHVWYFEIPRTVACQPPLSMGFSRQEYWRGLPFPNPGVEDIHTLKLQVFPNSPPCNIPLGVAYSKLSFLKLPCALIALLAGASQQPFSQLEYPFLWEPEAQILLMFWDPIQVPTLHRSNCCLLQIPSYFICMSLKAFITLYFVSLLFIDMSDLNFQTIF